MPRRDGTGPTGMGRITGRGAGLCTGLMPSEYANSGRRVGLGCGRRFRGMFDSDDWPQWTSFGYPHTRVNETAADEKESLSRQAEFLENQLQQVKERLSNFEEDAE